MEAFSWLSPKSGGQNLPDNLENSQLGSHVLSLLPEIVALERL